MVGRLAVSVLSSLLLVIPHVACADTRTAPVKAPTTTATTKTTVRPPAPAPPPPLTPPPLTPPPLTPPPAPATTAVTPTTTASTCVADPRTEVACLRRENEELRQQLKAMVAAEVARKERMAKQLGGGKAIDALK